MFVALTPSGVDVEKVFEKCAICTKTSQNVSISHAILITFEHDLKKNSKELISSLCVKLF